MENNMTFAITKDGSAKITFLDSTIISETARKLHSLSVTASAVLGRSLTAASIMGAMAKGENDTLTLQIKGDGPIGNIVCASDASGNVRGYVTNPKADVPSVKTGKINVGGAVGKGSLIVIRDMCLKEPYTGSCELVSGEIAEDVTEYYAKSEQIPTVCALGVRVEPDEHISASGGFLMQLLPGYDENIVSELEANISKLLPVSEMIYSGFNAEKIIGLVFNGIEHTVTEKRSVIYKCTCSKDKYARAIKSLGENAIDEMISGQEPVEAVCSFCNTAYIFSVDELNKMKNANNLTK